MLARVPGTKEARYTHLLAGDVEGWVPPPEAAVAPSPDAERIVRLEEDVATLRNEMAELKDQLARFRQQFE
jgi:uncharacterized protein YceH (UPF0502 family)